MTATSSLAQAHQVIGAYFCAFSRVEQEVGAMIKVVYRLHEEDAADAIIAALGDMIRKVNLVRAACQYAKQADGSDATPQWKASADAKITKIFSCNGDRVFLAHSLLQPNADGSVDIVRLKLDGGELKGKGAVNWAENKFREKIKELDGLATELASLREELKIYKIEIPNAGWMSTDFMQPRPIPPTLLNLLINQGQDWVPGPPPEATGKSG
jgi:hypothetical protein